MNAIRLSELCNQLHNQKLKLNLAEFEAFENGAPGWPQIPPYLASLFDLKSAFLMRGEFITPPRPTGRRSNYSWFAINLSGCGKQCQPPTPAGSDNGTNNIFL